uniref:Uncharacterized protein n=1 Tax=Setaria digitata TaxID=48799 RepID=A0A915PVB8_9BILA
MDEDEYKRGKTLAVIFWLQGSWVSKIADRRKRRKVKRNMSKKELQKSGLVEGSAEYSDDYYSEITGSVRYTC